MKADELKRKMEIRAAAVEKRIIRIVKTKNDAAIGATTAILEKVVNFLDVQKKFLELLSSDEMIYAYRVMMLACLDFLIAAYDEIINEIMHTTKRRKANENDKSNQ